MLKRKFVLAGILAFFLIIGIYSSHLIYNFSNQDSLQGNLTGQYNPLETSAVFNNKEIPTPSADLAQLDTSSKKVLGDEDSDEEKHIEVDLTNQKLYAFEGDKKVMEFLVSTGKWGKTPTGEFRIWTKLRYTKMSGGSKALHTYYYLPNVPYTMYFSGGDIPASRGYGIHGTYWHSNFGHPMSHGCINMKTEEAGQLFNWAHPSGDTDKSVKATADNPGTKIIIYGTAPNN